MGEREREKCEKKGGAREEYYLQEIGTSVHLGCNRNHFKMRNTIFRTHDTHPYTHGRTLETEMLVFFCLFKVNTRAL